MAKEFIRNHAGWLAKYVARAVDPWARLSYAQEGEDLLLDRLLSSEAPGFYVDVGAHHPKRFSNTHFFYVKGWRGLNIEPNPTATALFARMRQRDINLQFGISDQKGELLYFEFDDPALNTFDESLARERESLWSRPVLSTKRIQIERLDAVLDANLPAGQRIDFLTIDVEGLDLNVLRSNDWNRYRPRYLLSELLNTDLSIETVQSDPVIAFMREQEYRPMAKTLNTWFFVDARETPGPEGA